MRDTLLVRDPSTLPHLETAFGLDSELTLEPVHPAGGGTAAIDERGVFTVLLGLGLFDWVQLSVGIPVMFQGGPGLASEPNGSGSVPRGAAGDLRFAGRIMWPEVYRLGEAELRFGAAGWLGAPTGDAAALSGDRTWTGAVSAIGGLRFGVLRTGVELGGRFRGISMLEDASVGSELRAAAHVGIELWGDQLRLGGSVQGLFATASNARSSGLWLAEVEGRFFSDRRFQIGAGVGTGIGRAPGAPDLLAIASIRFTPTSPSTDRGGP